MIEVSEIQEYRQQYFARKKRAESMRRYLNDPAHPERVHKNRVRAHAHHHAKRGKKPSEIHYDPLAIKIRRLSERARRRTPEYREKHRVYEGKRRRAKLAAALAVGDLSLARNSMWRSAKHRAAKYGIPFDIQPEDITIPAACPVLGCALTVYGDAKSLRTNPSLDRLVPDLGYVRGNIVVVSHRANTMKNDATLEEMEKLLAFYRPLLKKQSS